MSLALWVGVSSLAAPGPAPGGIDPSGPTIEATTAAEDDAEARRIATTGALEVVGGAGAVAGGLVVLLVGRGAPGEVSTESQAVSDARSVGGSLLLISGLASTLVGVNQLQKAHTLRVRQAAVALDERGARLVVGGVF
ncbi:MAG: hypothetical protein ABMB14_14865 [Myxococcota bacterium]